ncbi:hypothetical protein [Scleromatobacter humisilvae]|uniref:Uncharacterized protein n=1 Tax=Scleromatobacter humisilvae TaxID=2897159 RepID=A0A9X1YJY4_9BURK|nr:hypothetical protein [Scleromatobacter humisilvae]MCK9687296.1 hypothetical protein [Scleromatobacter humisilvae]
MKSTEVALNTGKGLAAPAQKVKPAANDGLSDYLYKQLRGYGHVIERRLNDSRAHVTQLTAEVVASHESQRKRWKIIAFAVPIAGILVLASAKNGVDAWQARTARLEAEANMEVIRKEQEVRAADAKAYADAQATADQKLLAFVTGVDALPLDKTYAGASDMPTPAAVNGIKQAVTAILAGQPSDYAKVVDNVGPWPAPIVAKRLTDKSYLVGVAVRDGEARKVLVLYAQRGQPGQDDVIAGLRIPAAGVPERQFTAPAGTFNTGDFDFILRGQLREQFVRSFMPAPAAAASASTN